MPDTFAKRRIVIQQRNEPFPIGIHLCFVSSLFSTYYLNFLRDSISGLNRVLLFVTVCWSDLDIILVFSKQFPLASIKQHLRSVNKLQGNQYKIITMQRGCKLKVGKVDTRWSYLWTSSSVQSPGYSITDGRQNISTSNKYCHQNKSYLNKAWVLLKSSIDTRRQCGINWTVQSRSLLCFHIPRTEINSMAPIYCSL